MTRTLKKGDIGAFDDNINRSPHIWGARLPGQGPSQVCTNCGNRKNVDTEKAPCAGPSWQSMLHKDKSDPDYDPI
ncbi:hypothetical protein [uncultured Sneathiella sp.]|uniref:hypothetical protein n=1 Tax=uncultured Sneathiella sp. TaxID=879315 RepID=UPI0030EDF8E0|tara:strand:+ start:225 stop:449 length:225 start_codon:yes stop_codon:yes gene_type:complete